MISTSVCVCLRGGEDQDAEARQLLDTLHASHLAWINDKGNSSKKSAYTRARSIAQRRLREMKNQWWANKAQDLQQAADRRDMKAFYHGLRAVYGPRDSGSVPVRFALVMAHPSSLISLMLRRSRCLVRTKSMRCQWPE